MSERTQVTEVGPNAAPGREPTGALVVLSGPDQGKLLRLDRGSIVVGQSGECELRLTDAQVSRRHLEVTIDERGVTVRDLGSRNGSFLGALQISEVRLAPGAVVRVGRTELRLLGAPGDRARAVSDKTRFGDLLGGSVKMREVFAALERAAQSDLPILVSGETGTGKELCAEAIHAASRGKGPLIVCDLAGIPRSLIESELFGHTRGAFTGAVGERDGAFQRADGGTIFLDEIGELELDMQPRLLRALQQREVKRVGDARYRHVDVRIVSATNRDLAAECRAGRFREDLYHRLTTVQVLLPPLRERREDIPLLVKSWLEPLAIRATGAALRELMSYDWPGNVRELSNVVRRGAMTLVAGDELEAAELEMPAGAATPQLRDSAYKQAKRTAMETWERGYVEELLKRCDGNISRAAREGGLDRAYLHRLLRRHGIRAGGAS